MYEEEFDAVKFNETVENEEPVLTPSGLLAFLSQIEELDTKDKLGITTSDDGTGIQVFIGDSVYNIVSSADPVVVPEDTLAEIEEINIDGYEELESEGFEETDEPIEGGILKELVKTLAVGGLVRLTKNALQNS